MLQATIYTDTIAANAVLPRLFTGAYFNILSSTGPINVRTDEVNLRGLTAGQGFEEQPFARLELTDASGASNTITYVIADRGFLSGITGNMTISSIVPVQSGSFANSNQTITSVSAQLAAANTARKYLMIQNNDPTGNIFIGFGAAAVTVLNGFKITPGGFYEFSDVQSTQAIQAIGSIASNANVVLVQG